MACCLPTCARGSSVPVMGNAVFGVLWAFLFLLGVLCTLGSSSLSGLTVMYKSWVTEVCLLLDTPFGRRSVGALPQ